MGQNAQKISNPTIFTSQADAQDLHSYILERVEGTNGQILALPSGYPDRYVIPEHSHSRAQLFYTVSGVVIVSTQQGRWMVPAEHALWIPAGVSHSVEILGRVDLHNLYISPQAVEGLPTQPGVVALTELARCLLREAVTLEPDPEPNSRDGLLMSLLLHEIPRLPERPLALPFPTEARLAALCHRFVEEPTPQVTIDEWADQLKMSRRSFTRAFHRETGLSFSTWKQHACLFAALPRLAAGEAITTVALDLGYESPAAFTTMFKRLLGAPPRSYLGR